MKRFKRSAYLVAAMICTSLAVAGCGGNSPSNNSGSGAVVAPGLVPGVGVIGATGGQLAFTASQAYISNGVQAVSSGFGYVSFSTPLTSGTLVLGSTAAISPTQTLMGYSQDGSQIQVSVGAMNGFYAPISGYLTISAQYAQQYLGATGMSLQGLALDLWTNGSKIYGGSAYLCTQKSNGQCYGQRLDFIPF